MKIIDKTKTKTEESDLMTVYIDGQRCKVRKPSVKASPETLSVLLENDSKEKIA